MKLSVDLADRLGKIRAHSNIPWGRPLGRGSRRSAQRARLRLRIRLVKATFKQEGSGTAEKLSTFSFIEAGSGSVYMLALFV